MSALWKRWKCWRAGPEFRWKIKDLLSMDPAAPVCLTLYGGPRSSFSSVSSMMAMAEPARLYLGERKLNGDIVRRFGLGFAPPQGDWLVHKAVQANQPLDLLEQVGLIAQRDEGNGHYDRFRDRLMFPIRDMRGQTVGFGGRILPSSPSSAKLAKYYNSSDTVLFKKSDQLYGIDQARAEAIKAGYLAVVEGYTDVLMAHQMGVTNVVATMGTALNDRHVRKLGTWSPASCCCSMPMPAAIPALIGPWKCSCGKISSCASPACPTGLDPCDLLVQQGPEPLRQALASAVDVFEFKLQQVWQQVAGGHRCPEPCGGTDAQRVSPDY